MKITDVRAYTVLNRSIFVRVFTDEGITGYGECSPMQVQSGVMMSRAVLPIAYLLWSDATVCRSATRG